MPSDIVVARSQVPKPITELAEEIGLKPSEVHNAFLVGRAYRIARNFGGQNTDLVLCICKVNLFVC